MSSFYNKVLKGFPGFFAKLTVLFNSRGLILDYFHWVWCKSTIDFTRGSSNTQILGEKRIILGFYEQKKREGLNSKLYYCCFELIIGIFLAETIKHWYLYQSNLKKTHFFLLRSFNLGCIVKTRRIHVSWNVLVYRMNSAVYIRNVRV